MPLKPLSERSSGSHRRARIHARASSSKSVALSDGSMRIAAGVAGVAAELAVGLAVELEELAVELAAGEAASMASLRQANSSNTPPAQCG